MKSGADVRDLEQQFREIQKVSFGSHENFKCPLEYLRELVPYDSSSGSRMTGFVCDKTLIIREQDPDIWEKYLNEAPAALSEFNIALYNAIKLDDKSQSTFSLGHGIEHLLMDTA